MGLSSYIIMHLFGCLDKGIPFSLAVHLVTCTSELMLPYHVISCEYIFLIARLVVFSEVVSVLGFIFRASRSTSKALRIRAGVQYHSFC